MPEYSLREKPVPDEKMFDHELVPYIYADDPLPEHQVRVRWSDDEIVDAIKASTPCEALEAARYNWPTATIELAEGPHSRAD